MGRRHDIVAAQREFYFSLTGEDTSSGGSLETPKATMQAAIDTANNVSPPPSLGALAAVRAAQGGTYNESVVLEDFVLFEAVLTTMINGDPVVITAASTISARPQGVITPGAAATAVLIDGVSSFGLVTQFISTSGAASTGISIENTVADIFTTVDQIIMASSGSVGVSVTGESLSVIDMNFDVIVFAVSNTTFMDYNPSDSDTVTTVNFSSAALSTGAVGQGVNGTTGFLVQNGTLILQDFGMLQADIAIHVKTGATVIAVGADIAGDIIVDAGGTLIMILASHTGDITENGTIDGLIDGIKYGSYQKQLMLRAFSLDTQMPANLDSPETIEFGAAQNTGSDPIQINASGLVTFNVAGQYESIFNLQFGRIGAGGVSWIIVRFMLAGTQLDDTILVKLDGVNDDLPLEITKTLNVTAGQTMLVEMVRDSQGNNTGGLVSEDPTLLAWEPVPSAVWTIYR